MKVIKAIIRTLLILSQIYSAVLEITVKPRDTEAVVGQLTYLNCSTSKWSKDICWSYYAVGAHESTFIYFMEKLLPEYKDRARLETDEKSGAFNLVIETVQTSDAGKYFCQDIEQKQYSPAELIVLDEIPVCISDMKEDGIIGPNNCGIETEEIIMSCNASYFGNIPPIIEWTQDDIALKMQQKNYSRHVTSEIVIRGGFNLNDSSFRCQTTRSASKQFGCTPNKVKIMYGINNVQVTKVTVGDEATCLVNSSQSCTYRWMRIDRGREEMVSDGETFMIQSQGWYKCQANCTFRKKQCLLVAGQVEATMADYEHFVSHTGVWLMIILVGVVSLVLGVAGTLCCTQVSKRHRGRKHIVTEEEKSFFEDKNRELPPSEETSVDEEKSRELPRLQIFGMAIFQNDLLICRLNSENIEVYNLATFKYIRSWTMMDLVSATGLETATDGRNLFIFNFKEKGKECEIFRVDESCNLINKWKTKNAWGPLSATFDSNVILTDFPGSKLIEYSPEGNILKQIKLSSANIMNPRHAIKLSNYEYITCYGRHGQADHKVCIFTVKEPADLIEIKENDITRTSESRINFHGPTFLAVDTKGCIYVADKHNTRAVMLDSELKYEKDLVTSKKFFQGPVRLRLDEVNGRILVCDSSHIIEHWIQSQFSRQHSVEPVNSA